MLQNPSKYHPNPLSHFLALHNSANNNNNNTNNNHHHHYQQSTINNHVNSLNGNGNSIVNTSLDVGKSFTIAAILGLQKNAIEHHQQNHRDFNSVMNLSLNGHNTNNNNQKNNNFDCVNNNNNNNNICNNNNNSNNNNNNSNNSSGLNNFDCDSVNSVVNRYIPNNTNGNNNNNNNNNNGHLRITANHFGAVTVATKVNGPSALQSLQQLHHQHVQQQAAAAAASLGYRRDKIKDHLTSNKKSSLKSKRVRTIFTPEQLERLEAEFERQQYMVGPERLYLAHTLQLTEAQVKVWFQNRRIKWRKHHLEITQQRLALIRQTHISNGDEDGGIIDIDAGNNNVILNDNVSDLGGNIITAQNILSTNNNSPLIMTPINHHNNNNNQSESDLSICNDSIDGESIVDGDES